MKPAAVFLLASAAVALAQPPEETPTPPTDPKIDFKVSIVGRQSEFHMGEVIPIELSFGSRLKRRYQVDEAAYDRSGRMDFEHFGVVPADGAEDPLAEYFSPDSVHIGGGLRGSSFLGTKPWTIQLDLNEWVRFTKPGEYKVKVASSRVELVDSSKPYGTAPATALSNEITVKILPRDPEWENRTYEKATAILRDPSSRKKDASGDWPARRATEILRHLGTRDATRELAKGLRRGDGYFPTDCFFGLISSSDQAVAREALDAELARPDRPIDYEFLNALIWFETHDAKTNRKSEEGEEKALEKAMRALPNKRDEILPLCLYSLVDYTWIRGGKSLPHDADRLIEQLFTIFDRLTPEQKRDLLSTRWAKVKGASIIPLLKRYAAQEHSVEPGQDIHSNARTIAALALRRWFELDPEGARPAVIAEISRPKPRFGVREVGFMPDKTLPEVDRVLAEHFRGDEDFETASNFASLIARYGTREILPQILPKLDAKIGHWAPDIEDPLLAYLLRVDPEAARPRIEKALVGRVREGVLVQNAFQSIAAIHYDPVLEQVAIRALDGSNRALASSAAGLLAGYGTDAARAALQQRYEKWCKRWAGREGEINLKGVSAQYLQEGGTNELMLGRSLANALADATHWLTDEAGLQHLKAMTKVATIQRDFDVWIEKWHSLPIHLVVSSCGPANGAQPPDDVWQLERFSASVAQYDLYSPNELKEKLSQFPSGTKFELSLPWKKEDRGCIDDLRAFLASHEFSVTDATIDDGS
jgi:hypothetical protein